MSKPTWPRRPARARVVSGAGPAGADLSAAAIRRALELLMLNSL